MSHTRDCPDPRDARREGERAQERGAALFRNPYQFECDEAERAWRSGYLSAERREEERRHDEEAAERARLEAQEREAAEADECEPWPAAPADGERA